MTREEDKGLYEENTKNMKAQDLQNRIALMKEYKTFQDQFKDVSLKHVEDHPKSYISLFFIKQFLNDPSFDMARATKMYENLDPSLKNTKEGKSIKKSLDGLKTTEKKK